MPTPSDPPSKNFGPSPSFPFIATWNGAQLQFNEVNGLNHRLLSQPLNTSQAGNPPGKIELKRGILIAHKPVCTWLAEIRSEADSAPSRTVKLHLLDESKKPAMAWELHGATVTTMSSAAENPTGKEVAVESIEIAYETLIISAP